VDDLDHRGDVLEACSVERGDDVVPWLAARPCWAATTESSFSLVMMLW
jgi:hypothetical protein